VTLLMSVFVAAFVGALLSHLTARAILAHRFPRHPRLLHRVWARAAGYFWLPCPGCARSFGGHEWHRGADSTGAPYHLDGRVICPACTDRVDVLRELLREGAPMLLPTIATVTGIPRRRVRASLRAAVGQVALYRQPPSGRLRYRLTSRGVDTVRDVTDWPHRLAGRS